jgi:hypothetical protein
MKAMKSVSSWYSSGMFECFEVWEFESGVIFFSVVAGFRGVGVACVATNVVNGLEQRTSDFSPSEVVAKQEVGTVLAGSWRGAGEDTGSPPAANVSPESLTEIVDEALHTRNSTGGVFLDSSSVQTLLLLSGWLVCGSWVVRLAFAAS